MGDDAEGGRGRLLILLRPRAMAECASALKRWRPVSFAKASAPKGG